MTAILSNVFYDASSPWYYVIGVVFLVLIFGALTAYIMLSKKKEQSKQNSDAVPDEKNEAKTANGSESATEADTAVAEDNVDSASEEK